MQTAQAIYSVAQIRQIEAAYEAQFPQETPLMQRAGNAITAHVLAHINALGSAVTSPARPKILVLAGSGNNGGDGIVAALALLYAGIDVSIAFAFPVSLPVATSADSTDARQPIKHGLARAAFAAFCAQGGVLVSLLEAASAATAAEYTIIIDAIFGIGLNIASKPIDSRLYDFIAALNARRNVDEVVYDAAHVIALDLPSGIDAETGVPCLRAVNAASPAVALIADETLTFIGNKVGLHTGDGVDYAGQVRCIDLEIPSALLPKTTVQLMPALRMPTHFPTAVPSRRFTKNNVHKGTFGTAGIIGGAPGMVGAGWLAARAALLCGAGKTVFMQLLPAGAATGAQVDPLYPEIMHSTIISSLETPYLQASSAICIGPGLGQSAAAAALLARVLQQSQPLIIDADALTLLAADAVLTAHCCARALKNAVTILTPHPREAAVLLGCSTMDVQQNRVAAAQQIAAKFNAIIVLKGAGSITADRRSHVWINQSGNPGMASGGMGDVLTGMLCAAFCVHGPTANEAKSTLLTPALAIQIVANTVWLHGHAADCCVAKGAGPIGLRASEVAEQARAVLNG